MFAKENGEGTMRKNIIRFEYGIHVLFLVCLFLTIRWSTIPVINNVICEKIFIYKGNIDSAALNIVTGYITGYFVYALTVIIPDLKRKTPIRKEVVRRLTKIYYNNIYLLLLMCKNCCKTENEWGKVIRDKDIDCLGEDFLNIMRKFDITSVADSVYKYEKKQTRLSWVEYLNNKYKEIYRDLDDTFLEYQYYLENEEITIINKFRYSEYFDNFTGKGFRLTKIVTGFDKYLYYEDLPIIFYYTGENKLSPIFENTNMLKAYIEELKSIHTFLIGFNKKYKLKNFHEDFAISKLKEKNFGHLGTSRIEDNK